MVPFEEYEVSVEGRADGVLKSREVDEVDMINKIKCIYRELEQIKRVEEVHLAQAICAVYFYAKKI